MNNNINVEKSGWGVIVGRFQSPYLHEGHKYLINQVIKKHEKKMIVFIGVSNGQPTENNPLDFETRKKMIEVEYPSVNFIILPIQDMKSDEGWSNEIDKRINEIKGHSAVTLYGSRDSFVKYYCGIYDAVEVESNIIFSATALRKRIADASQNSQDFRSGVIYGVTNRFASAYLTVDVAILNQDRNEVMVCRKPSENRLRFIGGFVDPQKDDSIMDAAKREAAEETGGAMELSSFKIIGEAKIDDWRYRKAKEKIFTVFFTCYHSYGIPVPSDDIEFVEWIPYIKIRETEFEPEHNVLKELLLKELNLPVA